ncbi:MAG TPA: methyltransferase domain-containing protein [Thermoanaerobaculia bacterium]|nr:methyltransferase domain-containing protein [Thermoanaerobaculia bacterium]
MSLRERIALWRLERRLRQLQNAYYDGEKKDEVVILDYFRTLEAARTLYLTTAASRRFPRRVHLGSGDHRISGWINIDLDPAMAVDIAADLRRSIPLRNGSVDLIHSEDFIEHIDDADGKTVLHECHRVLREGGVMRILTPDLRALIDEIYVRREPRHLRWCSAYLDTSDPCEGLNMHLRMGGDHRFIYDEEHLNALLRDIGFKVRRVHYNWSPVPELRYLDLRDFGLNLFLECIKR